MLKIKVADNGDIEPVTAGWQRITPEGCPVHVLHQAATDMFVTVMCQRLEVGEPWAAYVLRCPQQGAPERLAGGTIDYDDDGPVYVGLQTQLDAYFE